MKALLRYALVAASVAVAGSAQALSFETQAGTSFSTIFSITPWENNKLVISVSGMAEQFSSLSFEILSSAPILSVIATPRNGSLIASFNDGRNDLYELSNKIYTLKIEGVTKRAIPGGVGVVSITSLHGTTTTLDTKITNPVPEPESYAMLLAGLGLMGAVARRRSKKS